MPNSESAGPARDYCAGFTSDSFGPL